MRFLRKAEADARRSPRAESFRSRDLVNELRGPLGPWLAEAGFRRLGYRGWSRPHADYHLMIAVQASQTGWDVRSGNRFVIEFERSAIRTLSSGFDRNRIWSLLNRDHRAEAVEIIKEVARTLPPPDPAVVSELPPDLRASYLRQWEPDLTVASSDVWFNYYDEADARVWGEFLARTIGDALERFLSEPPSLFGFRPPITPDAGYNDRCFEAQAQALALALAAESIRGGCSVVIGGDTLRHCGGPRVGVTGTSRTCAHA